MCGVVMVAPQMSVMQEVKAANINAAGPVAYAGNVAPAAGAAAALGNVGAFHFANVVGNIDAAGGNPPFLTRIWNEVAAKHNSNGGANDHYTQPALNAGLQALDAKLKEDAKTLVNVLYVNELLSFRWNDNVQEAVKTWCENYWKNQNYATLYKTIVSVDVDRAVDYLNSARAVTVNGGNLLLAGQVVAPFTKTKNFTAEEMRAYAKVFDDAAKQAAANAGAVVDAVPAFDSRLNAEANVNVMAIIGATDADHGVFAKDMLPADSEFVRRFKKEFLAAQTTVQKEKLQAVLEIVKQKAEEVLQEKGLGVDYDSASYLALRDEVSKELLDKADDPVGINAKQVSVDEDTLDLIKKSSNIHNTVSVLKSVVDDNKMHSSVKAKAADTLKRLNEFELDDLSDDMSGKAIKSYEGLSEKNIRTYLDDISNTKEINVNNGGKLEEKESKPDYEEAIKATFDSKMELTHNVESAKRAVLLRAKRSNLPGVKLNKEGTELDNADAQKYLEQLVAAANKQGKR